MTANDSTFENLLENFNTSARSYRNGKLPATALIAKYLALMQFKSSTNPQQEALTHVMFDAVIGRLQDMTAPAALPFGREFSAQESITPMFKILTYKGISNFTPETAPAALADVAVAASDAVEKFDPNYFFSGKTPAGLITEAESRALANNFVREMSALALQAQDYAIELRTKLKGRKP